MEVVQTQPHPTTHEGMVTTYITDFVRTGFLFRAPEKMGSSQRMETRIWQETARDPN